MKELGKLSLQGRVRRMRALALAALLQYPLELSALEYVAWPTNLLFRVRNADGRSYLLRVCAPGWRTDTDLLSEALWLEALARETEIGAPVPLRTRSGETIARAGAAGIPGERRCTVMSWLPGTPLGKHLTEANLAKMGELFARIHAHGRTFAPPEGFTQRRMDRLLARGEEDTLASDRCRASLPAEALTILDEVRARVDSAYAELRAGAGELQVIHNDLWHDNILLYRGKLHPLDFEDTCWGYPVQDLAMALQDLMLETPPEAYEALAGALRRGYEARAAWPEAHSGQIDTLRAGRMLWVANYVATFEAEYLLGFLERITPLLERYLETGRLLRRTIPESEASR